MATEEGRETGGARRGPRMVTLHTQYQRLCDELKSQTRTFNTAWWRIGEILREIKDGKLYAEEKLTWEAFCERYLSFTKRHADSLIKDSTTHAVLEDIYRGMGRILPTMSADAVRAVEDLPPKQAAKTIEKVEKRGGSVTANKIRASRQKPIEVASEEVPSVAAKILGPAFNPFSTAAQLPDKANADLASIATESATAHNYVDDGEPDAFIAGFIAGYERAQKDGPHCGGAI